MFREKALKLDAARRSLEALTITPNEAGRHGLDLNKDGVRRSAFALLSRWDVGWGDVARIWPELQNIEPVIAQQVEVDAKYAVYLERQSADVAAFRRDEALVLPHDLDYACLPGLSNEVRMPARRRRGRVRWATPRAWKGSRRRP